jgi:hypothetical protein
MTPPDHIELQEGDQIMIWLVGGDRAGNALFGGGTAGSPRAPQLIIRVFSPVVSKVEIDKMTPLLGANVFIQTTIRNNGTTMGSVNVTLIEEMDDGTFLIYESHNITELGPQQKRIVAFSWEAWESGKPDLYIMWNGDESDLTLLQPQIDVKGEDGDGGLFGSGSNIAMILGLLSILVAGAVIAIAAVMMRNRDEWDDEDEWEESEQIAEEMLGKEVTEGVTAQPSPIPQDAPLPEQTPPPGISDEEWLEEAKKFLPDWADDALLGYKNNGWSVEQLVEWKEDNQ